MDAGFTPGLGLVWQKNLLVELNFFSFSNPALQSALYCDIIIFTGYFYWSKISFCYINDIFCFFLVVGEERKFVFVIDD